MAKKISEITIVGPLPPTKGGITDYCLEQSNALAEHSKVNFISFKSIYPGFLYPEGSTVEKNLYFKPLHENVRVSQLLSWWNPVSWLHAGLAAKGEIFHFQWWTYFLFPVFFTSALVAKLRGKKIICTAHNVVGHESNPIDVLLSLIIFVLSDKIIVHSEKNKEQLHAILGVPPEKSVVIPMGVSDFYRENKKTSSSQRDARAALGVPQKAKVIMFFGNIRRYKGVEDLIEAFKVAKKKVPELFLIIAGKPWEKELHSYIKDALNGIPDKKLSLFYIESLYAKDYFLASDLVVLPYKEFTAQSAVGVQGISFGKPLLVSDVGSLPTLVLNKEFVFRNGNVKELAGKIMTAFTRRGLLESLSRDSLTLKETFSWKSIASKTMDFYSGLS